MAVMTRRAFEARVFGMVEVRPVVVDVVRHQSGMS
jgi:hypothetical protein